MRSVCGMSSYNFSDACRLSFTVLSDNFAGGDGETAEVISHTLHHATVLRIGMRNSLSVA